MAPSRRRAFRRRSGPPCASGSRPITAIGTRTASWRPSRAQGVEPVLFSLADVAVVTGGGEPLRVPGFPDALPDGVLMRTIAGGTFEATTMRLGVLHALVAAGVTVWNAPTAIERSVDKAATSLLIARAGLPTPDTWVVLEARGRRRPRRREARPGAPLVLKPLFGSQGEGLAPDRAAGGSARRGGGRAGLLSPALRAAPRRAVARLPGVRLRRPGDRRHDPRGRRLDHQRPSRRPAAALGDAAAPPPNSPRPRPPRSASTIPASTSSRTGRAASPSSRSIPCRPGRASRLCARPTSPPRSCAASSPPSRGASRPRLVVA